MSIKGEFYSNLDVNLDGSGKRILVWYQPDIRYQYQDLSVHSYYSLCPLPLSHPPSLVSISVMQTDG